MAGLGCQVAGCERNAGHTGPHGPERRDKLKQRLRASPEPVLAPMEKLAQDIGGLIGGVLDKHNEAHPHSPKVGFTLLMFTFGMPESPDQWMTYISNSNRDDMCAAMEEFLDRQVDIKMSDPRDG